AIMRDSRIGSYGTLALILSALARWSALAAAPGGAVLWAAIAAHAASRAVLPAFAAHVPPARDSGLSAGLGAIGTGAITAALGLGFVALLPLGLGFAVVVAVLLAGIFLLMGWLCRRQ